MIQFNNIKYFTIAEVAGILKCTPATVRQYMKRILLDKKKKFGRKIYLSEPDIEKILKK